MDHQKPTRLTQQDWDNVMQLTQLKIQSTDMMDKWSLEAKPGSLENSSSSKASQSDSTSSGSVSLEEGTSIRTTGFSKGFLAGHFIDRDEVPVISVAGIQIKDDKGLDSFVAKHLQTYYVKRVLSPFEFYLERESDTKSEERLRHQKMQEYYKKEDRQAFEYSIQVSKMKCYAYYDPHSKNWWRVRVQDFEFENGENRAYIYYCDTGKQEYVLCENLRHLHEDFQGAWDSAILKCYLYDVLPVSGNLHWSINALVFFKELVSDQRLGAVVMKYTRNPVVEHSPDMTTDCGVVLAEKLDNEERPDTINWLMVKMGYARSIGIMSSSPIVLSIQGLVPFFAVPTETTKESKSESNGKDGISIEVLRRITQRAMSNSGPDHSVYMHYERPMQSINNPANYLPFSIRSRLAWFRMSFLCGPSKIFIHTRNKKLELKAMEAELENICQDLLQPSLKSLSPGSVISCDMKDAKYKEENCWCRALVLKVDLIRTAAKVLMIDYGNIMTVHSSVIYQLPEKYRLIPSFVHRVHLSDIRPNYGVSSWHLTIDTHFVKYIISHEQGHPLYYLYLPDEADTVNFTDFNQKLVFDEIENKWVANDSSEDELEENKMINSMRNDPLLASHFCSHAVNIYYEVAVDEVKFWEFENLSDYLVKREYAELVKPRLDKDKIHEICRNGFGNL